MKTDQAGNLYISGIFRDGNALFGTDTLYAKGLKDGFILKLNSSGDVIWSKLIATKGNDAVQGIQIDQSSNVYITGYYTDSLFAGTDTLVTSNVEKEIYLAKLNSSGNFLWSRSAGKSGNNDEGFDIDLDNSGNIYITGYFGDTAYFGNQSIFRSGDDNMFLAKYSNTGNIIWVTSPEIYSQAVTKNAIGFFVRCDVLGGVYVSGQFSDTAVFSSQTIYCANGVQNFLAKYSSNGLCSWARNVGGYGYSGQIATDDSANVYVLKSNNGYSISKYNPNGSEEWSQSPSSSTVSTLAINVDRSGNIFIAGDFTNSATFNQTTITSLGGRDALLAKLPPFSLSVPKPGNNNPPDIGVSILPMICCMYH